jgi:hypothetical protein
MSLNSTPPTGDPAKPGTVLTVTLSPAFLLVFKSVLALTLICLVLGCCLVGLAVHSGRTLTPQETGLLDLFTSTFKLGFGAILGLLGGKTL